MPDRHRAQAALGGGGLTGVVDDERIDHRQAAYQGGGKAGLRQRHRLARQPFQGAVRAQVHQRVDCLHRAQPQIERNIGVARRQFGVVVAGLAIQPVAAVRLHRQQHRPQPAMPQHEPAFGQGRIVLRLAPGRDHAGLRCFRQGGEQAPVLCQMQHRRRRRIAQHRRQRGRGRQRNPGRIAGVAQQVQHGGKAGKAVQPDGMGDLPARARIVRQHHRHPALSHRRRAQPCPPGGPIGGQRDPRRVRPVDAAGELQPRFELRVRLERNGGRQQPAVQFRQHHLHRQIGLRQPAEPGPPGLDAADRQHQLQHRNPGGIQRRSARVPARREPRGIQDHGRAQAAQQVLHESGRRRVLQAADMHRPNRQPALGQRRRQRIHRRQVAGQQMGAIEHDHRQGPAIVRVGQGVHDCAFHRHGDRCLIRPHPRQMPAQRQGARGILRPALAQQRRQPAELAGLDSGQFRQPWIVPHVARHHRQRDAPGPAQGGDFLGPIAPVIQPAEQPHHHASGPGDHLLGIEVHRHRMAQPRQAGQPQSRPVCRRLPRRGPRP